MQILLFLLLCSLGAASAQYQSNYDKLSQIKNLTRIAIASCNNQRKKQTVWKDLLREAPELFIWGGDNVYADTKIPAYLARAYQVQNSFEDYRAFKGQTPIIGTWDDHDYGANNSGHEYVIKKESQKLALDFLEEPEWSPRRLREGIYTSYDFGDPGKRVKIIILDNRYFKDLEKDSPMLGSTQWKWFESEINQPGVNLFLIVSGLSILSPTAPASEEWADYPTEQERIGKLLQKTQKPYLYVTGDKHFSSIFRRKKELEFLVSGMTHNTRVAWRPYIRMKYPNHVFVHNYGLIELSWTDDIPVMNLTVRSSKGHNLLMKRISWNSGMWQEIP